MEPVLCRCPVSSPMARICKDAQPPLSGAAGPHRFFCRTRRKFRKPLRWALTLVPRLRAKSRTPWSRPGDSSRAGPGSPPLRHLRRARRARRRAPTGSMHPGIAGRSCGPVGTDSAARLRPPTGLARLRFEREGRRGSPTEGPGAEPLPRRRSPRGKGHGPIPKHRRHEPPGSRLVFVED